MYRCILIVLTMVSMQLYNVCNHVQRNVNIHIVTVAKFLTVRHQALSHKENCLGHSPSQLQLVRQLKIGKNYHMFRASYQQAYIFAFSLSTWLQIW